MNSSELFAALKELSSSSHLDPDLELSVFIDINGPDPAQWQGRASGGKVSLEEGQPQEPDITVSASSETALGLYNKTVNPMVAFMTGKIKVKGDLSKVALLKDLFNKKKK